jgi:YD repeat-containing protein
LDVENDGVYFVDDAAVRLVFPLPTPGGAAVLPEEGPRWRLALSAAGAYTIHKPESGWTLAFGPGRRGTHPLARITNRCGHVIEFRYDDGLAPTEVLHSGGYRVGVETDAGRVVRLWLDDGQGGEITTSRYGYDARGDLVEIVNSSNRAFRLEYDDAARITKWIDRNDEWYQYFYDHRGRVVRTDGSGGAVTGTWDYDSAPRTTLYTNALGETTTYRLNDRRQVIEQIDPLGNSTRQEWSRLDQRLSRTDPLGRTTRYTYGDNGNLVAVTRPDGTQTTAEFNELHLPVVVVEPDGAIWRYTYDANGNVSSSTNPVGLRTEYAYDAAGGLASVTDPTGQTRLVEADRAGLPVALTNSLGETTRYGRDAFGRISAVVDPAGNTVRQTWTIEGRLRTRTLPDGTSASWRHDPEGNQIEYVDPLGAVTRLERTHFGLPAVEIGPDGSRLTYRYDRELHLVSVTNEQGLDWRYEYDARRQPGAGDRLRRPAPGVRPRRGRPGRPPNQRGGPGGGLCLRPAGQRGRAPVRRGRVHLPVRRARPVAARRERGCRAGDRARPARPGRARDGQRRQRAVLLRRARATGRPHDAQRGAEPLDLRHRGPSGHPDRRRALHHLPARHPRPGNPAAARQRHRARAVVGRERPARPADDVHRRWGEPAATAHLPVPGGRVDRVGGRPATRLAALRVRRQGPRHAGARRGATAAVRLRRGRQHPAQ